MKSIMNLNTVNAFIRDERMASKEYAELARRKDTPDEMKILLMKLSKDEAHHKKVFEDYKKWLISKRKS